MKQNTFKQIKTGAIIGALSGTITALYVVASGEKRMVAMMLISFSVYLTVFFALGMIRKFLLKRSFLPE